MLKSWGKMPRVALYLLSHPLLHWQNLWWTRTYLLRTFLCPFPSLPGCRPLPAFQTIFLKWICLITGASRVALVVKNLPAKAGNIRGMGWISWLGRSSGGGHGNPLKYSCLENPMDRGAWQAIVHGVAKSQTQLKWNTHTHTPKSIWKQSLLGGVNFLTITLFLNKGLFSLNRRGMLWIVGRKHSKLLCPK